MKMNFCRIFLVSIFSLPYIFHMNTTLASEYVQEGEILPLGSAEESLVYVNETGNYILTYKTFTVEGNDMLFRIEFVPSTKINPKMYSRFEVTDNKRIQYTYKIRNGKSSRQNIKSIMMLTSGMDEENIMGPAGWRYGAFVFSKSQLSNNSTLLNTNVAWSDFRKNINGIFPGKSEKGFTYQSHDLPGVGEIKLSGYVKKVMGFAGEGPQGEIGDQFDKIYMNNFIVKLAPVAHIPVDTPFNAAKTLAHLQHHINTDLIKLNQIDAALVPQIDRLFEAAIPATALGNMEAAKNSIEMIIDLIDNDYEEDDDKDEKNSERYEHDDNTSTSNPISKLAARVIKFDLDYIKDRLEKEADHK